MFDIIKDNKIRKKSYIYRKSSDFIRRGPRRIQRILSSSQDYVDYPPIIANSVPKSGTHLIMQILEQLPDTRFYGAFLASKPSMPYKERSEKNHKRLLRAIAPGEITPMHLFYSEMALSELRRKNSIIYFIYRDPRDVVLSEMHFITRMHRIHQLHKIFKNLNNDDERLSFAILGNRFKTCSIDYRDIGERYRRYIGWIDAPDTLPICYEKLNSPDKHEIIEKMVDFFIYKRSDLKSKKEEILMNSMKGINPERSHTFRSGETGEWRTAFQQHHIDQFKEVAGDLLIKLGYEDSYDW